MTVRLGSIVPWTFSVPEHNNNRCVVWLGMNQMAYLEKSICIHLHFFSSTDLQIKILKKHSASTTKMMLSKFEWCNWLSSCSEPWLKWHQKYLWVTSSSLHAWNATTVNNCLLTASILHELFCSLLTSLSTAYLLTRKQAPRYNHSERISPRRRGITPLLRNNREDFWQEIKFC